MSIEMITKQYDHKRITKQLCLQMEHTSHYLLSDDVVSHLRWNVSLHPSGPTSAQFEAIQLYHDQL